jgi:8-oxo-dGTP diphosphatase
VSERNAVSTIAETSVPGERARDETPALAISTVIFTLREHPETGRPQLLIPLVRRTRHPHLGKWALPGGPLGSDESLTEAAARNLRETTGLSPRYLEQLYAFGGLDRSADHRVVSIVYWALVQASEVDTSDDNVCWLPVDELDELAFDHNEIVDYALWRLRTKAEYSAIAYHLLGETFTLSQLHAVSEVLTGKSMDQANFRRTIAAEHDIEATQQYLTGGRHRPPRLYRYVGSRTSSLTADAHPRTTPTQQKESK